MSLWLQSALEALEEGAYSHLWGLVTHSPIPFPSCMLREIEYSETHFHENSEDRLFPIRFMWLMELHEQRMFGHVPLGRSRYHPEKLLEFWKRVENDGRIASKWSIKASDLILMTRRLKCLSGGISSGKRLLMI